MNASTSACESATDRDSAWRNATLRHVESKRPPQDFDRDERLSIPLDPEDTLRGLLKVDPDSEPKEDRQQESKPDPERDKH